MPATAPTSSSGGTTNGILLVEEYGALAVAISAALKKFAPFHPVRVARTLAEAEAAAEEMRPDLFVLDLDPPPSRDVDFFSKLQSRFPEGRALVIAAGTSPELHAARGTSGAVQFIEKPFDLGEFGAAVQALLGPWSVPPSHSFRGTLRDLHVVDIVQLKCLAMSTAIVRLETAAGHVGEIHFRDGEITHAATGDLQGVAALEEIVAWPGGQLSEAEKPEGTPHTMNSPWADLLLQAVRKATEKGAFQASSLPPKLAPRKVEKTILVIDDTEMLLIFAADVLGTANNGFDIVTALTGHEGLLMAEALRPDLILLDYSLSDTTGAEVCRGLLLNEATARIPVLMMSGHLPELANTAATYGNVVATLPKPFLSGALINAVEKILAAGPLLKAPVVPPLPAAPTPPPAPAAVSPKPPSANGHGHGNSKAQGAGPTPPLPPTAPAPNIPASPLLSPKPPAPAAAGAVKEVGVTFSMAITSMQLTPDFRMDSLQLTPAASAVGVRVADGGDIGMLVETGFHLGPAQLDAAGKIATVFLVPTLQPPHLATGGSAFAVSHVHTQAQAQNRVVELTAAKDEAMRVQMTAQFEFITVELTPAFEIAAVVLRARDSVVHIGTGAEQAVAPFEIMAAQLDAGGRLSQVSVRAIR